MWRSVLLALLVGATAVAQDAGDGDEVYPPEGDSKAVGVTIFPPNPLADASSYWTMSEAGTADRVDSTGPPLDTERYDLTYVSGACDNGVGHLGNALTSSGTCTLETLGWHDAGQRLKGLTFVGWFKMEFAGAPSLRHQGLFGSAGEEGFMFALASLTGINFQWQIKGQPSDGGVMVAQECDTGSWCFVALVVKNRDVTMYLGNDTGTALTTDTDTLAAGDRARAMNELVWEAVNNGGWDDFSYHNYALKLSEIEAAYNVGAGNAPY